MAATVQRLELADGSRSWTVLGEEHLPVAPVEEFLEYHRMIGSSPNTVRSYAQALAGYFAYLGAVGGEWADPGVSGLSGFPGWLKSGGAAGVSVIGAAARGGAAPATVAARLAAVVAFYRYLESAGHQVRVPHAPAAGRQGQRFVPFLVHTQRSAGPAAVMRVARERPGPPPILSPAQVRAVLDCCARFDPGLGAWSGSLRDRLLFALLAESGLFSRGHRPWRKSGLHVCAAQRLIE